MVGKQVLLLFAQVTGMHKQSLMTDIFDNLTVTFTLLPDGDNYDSHFVLQESKSVEVECHS